MNKQELVQEVMNRNVRDIASKAGAQRIVESIFDIIMDEVSSDGKVAIQGFGTFGSVLHGARIGRNPRTGEEFQIGAHRVPNFKPSTGFKDKVK